jgi:hypothetical protein
MSLLGYLKGFLGSTRPRISDMTRSYLQTALYTSSDEDGRPLDRDYSESNFSADAMTKADQDVTKFAFDNGHLYVRIGMSSADAARLFWYARTGSGITFMDNFTTGTVEYQIAQRLQANAEKYGVADVYAGDDGELEIFTG